MNATTKVDDEATIYLVLALWLFIRLWDHGVVFSISLIVGFKKMSVSNSFNEMLSWLIKRRYWLTNQWHAICWQHILVPAQVAWNPGRAGTILVAGTRYYDLIENPENKPWQVESTNGKGALKRPKKTK